MAGIINFETFFKNHFDNRAISDDDLKKFSEDHLARITANNPGGRLTPIIAPAGSAHTAYFGAITDEDTARAIQQALTIRVDDAAAAFTAYVRRREGAIRDAFGQEGPEYQEFFPQGLSEYTRADRANIEQLMDRFADAARRHVDALPQGFEQEVLALRAAYQSARTGQLGKKGEVGDRIEDSIQRRNVLETQLTANVHFIGFQFPGNVEQCMAYFDQSFIRRSGNGGAEEPQPPQPTPQP